MGLRSSAASRVFLVLGAAGLLVAAVVAVALVVDAQRSARTDAENLTRSVAEAVAESIANGAGIDGETASLQTIAERIRADAGADFITIMRPDGERLTHPNPDRIGETYVGTVPSEPEPLTEQFTGTLGPSVRTITPVIEDGVVTGWVAVGVTLDSISQSFSGRLPLIAVIVGIVVALGLGAAVSARAITRRVTGDLQAEQVREAVSAYESVRTLGDALRAQTHEHGNRMHTAVALLELGRVPEAVEILTETTRQSQDLVDQVTLRSQGDPTVGALLLGKAAQARERGVAWSATLDPTVPRSVLTPIDAVSVVGNLIDNAIDAAAGGPEPRWVSVQIAPASDGGRVRLEVSDSGAAVSDEVERRMWENGYSTKPAGAQGRGVGLSLVRAVVEAAGGTIEVTWAPTRFRVELPGRPR